MKIHRSLVWIICLAIPLFFSACASHKNILPPQTLPAENLPQIGIRQAAVSKENPRLEILDNLIKKAEHQIRSEEPEAAFATLERGVGIDAQDPVIWHLMARVRLMQGNFDQAEQLAKKSNLLAVRNPSLEKKNGDIIASSRILRGMTQEAGADK